MGHCSLRLHSSLFFFLAFFSWRASLGPWRSIFCTGLDVSLFVYVLPKSSIGEDVFFGTLGFPFSLSQRITIISCIFVYFSLSWKQTVYFPNTCRKTCLVSLWGEELVGAMLEPMEETRLGDFGNLGLVPVFDVDVQALPCWPSNLLAFLKQITWC